MLPASAAPANRDSFGELLGHARAAFLVYSASHKESSMSDALGKLFHDFDRGYLSRRQLLQALGIAAVMRPAMAFAQGTCGGTNAALPRCNPTPAKLPFEPTGWKTVLLDHFSMQVADYKKEAAYFNALMNWKIRSDDGTQAVLD